ncbi:MULTISPECIES: ATP-binding cassette domain-containing protein [Peribacillus]|uniref:ATP-binding cassette domain-containing protein n=1 Tax=Peribacillus TaxID=2675229 RepID=UPI0019137946|nr:MULTISPECIES: ATP-binding cassette domain-containing protein [unclassified Peribacillus]MBK5444716.1 ATP-binding cassette domain-containing protein [Peribacillus sp. TH24]MBK5460579.1 ATP-binding cassette domain-containing protein [Peribacillus sp. TH27]MBK5482370.1 ATP-binding cassette domain-containing protein [Peribacillus sp. TH16]MBK5498734.1 ATP-binding cassette domain-containing protein [Peribacillus sp. TH14]WMX56157.1 ATP-binding cassette domain-containing protein [Peribacillus sp.
MIEIHEITKTFQDKKIFITALKHVSLDVRRGQIVGLLGENGAGKTTLLRSIATLLTPTDGYIKVAGFDTLDNPNEIKKRIGVLFGGETGLYDRLTTRENLAYFATLYGLSKHETKVRIEELAVMFGMKDYLDRKVGGFSKGMRQKVAISRTLIHDPDIILFDEPTTGLDITSSNVFRQLVLQLKQQGKTIIFSSHIMEEVTLLCDSVAMMHKGELIYKGKLESLYIEENSRDLNYIFMSKLVRGNQSHVS